MAQTILVVDDDASIRDAVSFYMRREGYDVLQAKDGQAAMEVIATENFDLAILDIMMEGYNGFELCSAIRDRNQTVPIILLSAKRLRARRVGHARQLVPEEEPGLRRKERRSQWRRRLDDHPG